MDVGMCHCRNTRCAQYGKTHVQGVRLNHTFFAGCVAIFI
jgi:hypothetical protein